MTRIVRLFRPVTRVTGPNPPNGSLGPSPPRRAGRAGSGLAPLEHLGPPESIVEPAVRRSETGRKHLRRKPGSGSGPSCEEEGPPVPRRCGWRGHPASGLRRRSFRARTVGVGGESLVHGLRELRTRSQAFLAVLSTGSPDRGRPSFAVPPHGAEKLDDVDRLREVAVEARRGGSTSRIPATATSRRRSTRSRLLLRRLLRSVERRGRDLNPRSALRRITVFETAAFDRSATPPRRRRRDSNPRWSHSAP